ncbi:uncharacterized protein MONOS_14978 [Monocercomonoides exilis]|uniref:uncharacterized protein n=1 Tax=Monocercomonoides exilis TaxID=2049356 RepID=UPI00355A4165|nr:hypothetical protein MONOS_14978 [Monocercomonoides exilis]|eukprot:MONOS_14978.1-p1 / transcript=MONOS_14978.1 / gene=MONOS_14978 / organism=Monocercomonoides_exilis_PA203 / gene_product=unspecified product / transcript_product=unspecified product / location=Mono_scaffold01119:4760-5482(-) / protein_length=241 / sequence_SO=supercontig / SO=protein_coding / is_pseudo=false
MFAELNAKVGYKARVFDSYEDMCQWLSVQDNVNTLQTGQTFYLKETNDPDYWWDGTELLEIEKEQISLENYYNKSEIDAKQISLTTIVNVIYPINSVIIKYDASDPSKTYPGTSWKMITNGRFIRAASSADLIGTTSGSSTSGATTLTTSQIPSHTHSITIDNSGEHTHALYHPLQSIGSPGNILGMEFNWDSSGETHFYTAVGGSHNHSASLSTTGGSNSHTHTIDPPAIYLAIWRRTA